MGNQINMIASMELQKHRGFEVIGTQSNDIMPEAQLKNEGYREYFLPADPDERDIFIRCPVCKGLIQDTGLSETVQCDICKKIIKIPENIFQEVKQLTLFQEPKKKYKFCNKISNFCKKLSFFLPFTNNSFIFSNPSFKKVSLYMNKEKYDNSPYHDKDFSEIMNNVIIPFFQFKSRILTKDKIFEIDGLEFKVVAIFPHYITAKVTSKTSIICNNFYSHTIPRNEVTFLTMKRRELESNDFIVNQIINTPYPSQKSIIEGLNCRINTYDLVVRNSTPKYGIITNETNVRVINRNIEIIKSITIVVLQNDENEELSNKKYSKIIMNYFIYPFFYDGNKKYVERGDIINIKKLKIFVLKAKPSTGFVTEDITKIKIKYDYTLEQCQNELNEQIEKESLQNAQNMLYRQRPPEININNNDFIISTNNNSLNSMNQLLIFNQIQERMRLLNALLSHRRRLLRLNSQYNNNMSQEDNNLNIYLNVFNTNNIISNNEEILNSLPVFKIDQKFMETSKKEENKNEQFQKCIICMEKYEINDEVKTLPCFHIFHKDCIDQWLRAGNDTCPICKNKVNHNTDDINGDFRDQ